LAYANQLILPVRPLHLAVCLCACGVCAACAACCAHMCCLGGACAGFGGNMYYFNLQLEKSEAVLSVRLDLEYRSRSRAQRAHAHICIHAFVGHIGALAAGEPASVRGRVHLPTRGGGTSRPARRRQAQGRRVCGDGGGLLVPRRGSRRQVTTRVSVRHGSICIHVYIIVGCVCEKRGLSTECAHDTDTAAARHRRRGSRSRPRRCARSRF
jgi:hypothetical protein